MTGISPSSARSPSSSEAGTRGREPALAVTSRRGAVRTGSDRFGSAPAQAAEPRAQQLDGRAREEVPLEEAELVQGRRLQRRPLVERAVGAAGLLRGAVRRVVVDGEGLP